MQPCPCLPALTCKTNQPLVFAVAGGRRLSHSLILFALILVTAAAAASNTDQQLQQWHTEAGPTCSWDDPTVRELACAGPVQPPHIQHHRHAREWEERRLAFGGCLGGSCRPLDALLPQKPLPQSVWEGQWDGMGWANPGLAREANARQLHSQAEHQALNHGSHVSLHRHTMVGTRFQQQGKRGRDGWAVCAFEVQQHSPRGAALQSFGCDLPYLHLLYAHPTRF